MKPPSGFSLSGSVHSQRPTGHSASAVRMFAARSLSLSLLELSFLFVSFCSSLSSSFDTIMASPSSLGAHGNVSSSLLTGIVETIQTEEFDENFRVFSLNAKQFLKSVVRAYTALSHQVADVLRTKMQG